MGVCPRSGSVLRGGVLGQGMSCRGSQVRVCPAGEGGRCLELCANLRGGVLGRKPGEERVDSRSWVWADRCSTPHPPCGRWRHPGHREPPGRGRAGPPDHGAVLTEHAGADGGPRADPRPVLCAPGPRRLPRRAVPEDRGYLRRRLGQEVIPAVCVTPFTTQILQ